MARHHLTTTDREHERTLRRIRLADKTKWAQWPKRPRDISAESDIVSE